jgi:hypothetical protein
MHTVCSRILILAYCIYRLHELDYFTTVSRLALGPTQPPIQWVPGTVSLGVKPPRREANHSPPSSTEVKNEWSYTSTLQYIFMARCLVKYKDNFTFTFTFTCTFYFLSRLQM